MMFSEINPKIDIPVNGMNSDGSFILPSLTSKSNECKGNGGCLILQSNTLSLSSDYIQNPNIQCNFHCQPKECPNYLFCKRKAPEWVLQCNCGLCDNCSSTFGMKLQFFSNQTCLICQEKNTTCIQYKHCKHYSCMNCFSYSFYGTGYEFYDIENEPKFPYPKEIEEEYYDDEDNPKLINDKLLQKYLQDWNEWDERRENMKQRFLDTLQKKKKGSTSSSKKVSNEKKTLITQSEEDTKEGEGQGEIEEFGGELMLGICPICKK